MDLAIAAVTAVEPRHFLMPETGYYPSDVLPRDRSTMNKNIKTELPGLNYVGLLNFVRGLASRTTGALFCPHGQAQTTSGLLLEAV